MIFDFGTLEISFLFFCYIFCLIDIFMCVSVCVRVSVCLFASFLIPFPFLLRPLQTICFGQFVIIVYLFIYVDSSLSHQTHHR